MVASSSFIAHRANLLPPDAARVLPRLSQRSTRAAFFRGDRAMMCPICKREVKVIDPYRHEAIKRASAWFARHRDREGKKCLGSMMTAINRHPRPASEEDTPIE